MADYLYKLIKDIQPWKKYAQGLLCWPSGVVFMHVKWSDGDEYPTVFLGPKMDWEKKKTIPFLLRMFTQNPNNVGVLNKNAFTFEIDGKKKWRLSQIKYIGDGVTSRVYSVSYQPPQKTYKDTDDKCTRAVVKLVWNKNYQSMVKKESDILTKIWDAAGGASLYIPKVISTNEMALLMTPQGEKIKERFTREQVHSLIVTLKNVHKLGYGKKKKYIYI